MRACRAWSMASSWTGGSCMSRAWAFKSWRRNGPVTADTLFRIASMTKSFTALSILKLRDEGRLSLDAPAETYLPEIRGWKYPTEDSPRIRVRELLTHTAGFVTDDPWGDRQTPLPEADFTRLLRDGVPFTRPPATAMEYSNLGYAMLGRVVANVAQQPYKDYVERTLLGPLGMTSSGFEVTQAPAERRALGYRWGDDAWQLEPTMAHGAFGAMGGLQTSANDYAKYVAWLLSAWPPRDGADAGPVKRASVRELAQGANYPQLRRRFGKSGDVACLQASAYGMGMIVAVDCELGLTLSHGGGYPGLWLVRAAAARLWCRYFRARESDLCRPAGPGHGCGDRSPEAGLLKGQTGNDQRGARERVPSRWEDVHLGRSHVCRRCACDELPAGPLGRRLGSRARGSEGASRQLRDERAHRRDRRALGQFHLALRAWPAERLVAARADTPAAYPVAGLTRATP